MGEPPQRSAKQHAVKAGHHPLNLIPELRDKLLHWRFSLGPRLRIWSSNNVHLRRNASYCLCLASASAPASSMKNTKTQWHAKSNGVTIILPSETEAGSAGMQPCRGIAWWAHRDDAAQRENYPLALLLKITFIGSKDPHALKIQTDHGHNTHNRRTLSLHFPLNQNSLRLAAMRGRIASCGRFSTGLLLLCSTLSRAPMKSARSLKSCPTIVQTIVH